MARLPKKLEEQPLSDAEEQYVTNLVHYGLTHRQAAKNAGVSFNSDRVPPKVLAAIKQERDSLAERETVTRGQIVRGLRDAIDQAVVMGDPGVQVQGWREVAKVTDNYEPKKDHGLTDGHRRVLDQLSKISETDLLRMLEKPIDGRVIDMAEADAGHPSDGAESS